ncbi:MAG TPA: hypothetical protein VJ872_03785 [Nocardioides sp.]|nr:hypothetical protein [Nocardioides sp.]
MSKRLFSIVFGLAVLAVIAGVGIGVFRATNNLGFGPTGDCTATVNGHTVEIDRDQAENATLIASVAIRRGLPARATSIALATAMQESKLRNLTAGDRDSVGLFQQRPSQGWGTRAQLMDRVYATNAFFDALVKVNGYESMEITVAAQKVQRSAYPSAYAAHEEDARALASALTGYSPAAFSCDLSGGAPSTDSVQTSSGLSGRASAVRDDVRTRFGSLPVHLAGRAGTTLRVDVSAQADPQTYGWALAQYLAGNAGRLQIRTIDFAGEEWRAGRSGWQPAPAASGSVRVEVFG